MKADPVLVLSEPARGESVTDTIPSSVQKIHPK